MSHTRVKFTSLTRTINPVSGIHYLDAIDEDGRHWTSHVNTFIDDFSHWKPSPTHPCRES